MNILEFTCKKRDISSTIGKNKKISISSRAKSTPLELFIAMTYMSNQFLKDIYILEKQCRMNIIANALTFRVKVYDFFLTLFSN